MVWIFFPQNSLSNDTWIPLEKAGLNLRFSIHKHTSFSIQRVYVQRVWMGYFNQQEGQNNKSNLYLLIHSTKIAFGREIYFANKGHILSVSLRLGFYTEENVTVLLQCSTCVTY